MIRSALLRRPTLRVPILILLVTCIVGCASTKREPEGSWVSAEIEAGSARIVWEYALLALDKQGFPLGSNVDPARMQVVTGWKNTLLPFKGEGYRQQAEVGVKGLEAGRYTVRVRVRRQTNESLIRPTDLTYAQWEWAADDEVTARILLQHIRAYLAPAAPAPPTAR